MLTDPELSFKPGFEDYYISAGRDYKNFVRLQKWLPDEAAVSGCLFLIEQAVEKSLKGYILLLGQTPVHTTNIGELLDQCRGCGVTVPGFADDIADSLTLWAADVRYDPFIRFSDRKYGLAKQTFCWAYGKLSAERRRILNSDGEEGGADGFAKEKREEKMFPDIRSDKRESEQ